MSGAALQSDRPFRSLRILGARMDLVSLPEIFSAIDQNRAQRGFLQIITVNSLMLLELERDRQLREVFELAGLLVPESSGLSLIARLKGLPRFERLPGIDLLQRICAEAPARAWSVFLLGSKPGAAEAAARRLRTQSPKLEVRGTHHGYFTPQEERSALEQVRSLQPDIVFVGLQMPEQEKWIRRHADSFRGMTVMGVGGSFDVLSGRLKRAPILMQRLGLEWLYRFAQEPWRWRRMALLPVVVLRALFSSEKH